MAKAASFISREGHLLQHSEWLRMQKNHEYRFFREFENTSIHATCEWVGAVRNATSIPQSHWKPFRLNVVNIVTTDGEGRPLETPRRSVDPTATRDFRTEAECIDAYEDILVRYAGCEFLPSDVTGTGFQFVEKGNKLVPLPPDTPDVRTMPDDMADIAGSW